MPTASQIRPWVHAVAHGDGLDAAAALLGAVDRLMAAVLAVLQSAEHHTVVVEHGITRDTWLRAMANRTGADAGMLLAGRSVSPTCPPSLPGSGMARCLGGAVRCIVLSTRNLTAAQRRWIDDTLRNDRERVLRLDGDQLIAAVDGLVARARPDLHADQERAGLSRRWLVIQPRLDGTATIHGALDAETAAAALSAFATTSHAEADSGHGTDHAAPPAPGDAGTLRAMETSRPAMVHARLTRRMAPQMRRI